MERKETKRKRKEDSDLNLAPGEAQMLIQEG